MIYNTLDSSNEDIKAIRSPTDHDWRIGGISAKIFPISLRWIPTRGIPCLVVNSPVCSLREDIQTIWFPTDCNRRTDNGTAYIFPLCFGRIPSRNGHCSRGRQCIHGFVRSRSDVGNRCCRGGTCASRQYQQNSHTRQ